MTRFIESCEAAWKSRARDAVSRSNVRAKYREEARTTPS